MYHMVHAFYRPMQLRRGMNPEGFRDHPQLVSGSGKGQNMCTALCNSPCPPS
jgi:hypothetical protein